MSPERYEQLNDLFNEALELAPEQRARFLADACAGDESLRQEVEALLKVHENADSFLAKPAAELEPGWPISDETLPLPGRQLGRFQVLSLLGAGGMGEVYAAHDTKLQRPVALKMLPAHFTLNPERLRRFEQEAMAASSLNHPNIITIYDIGETEAGRFIAMEFVQGQTLRTLAKEPIPLPQLTQLGKQIAEALSVAHAAGITHRDIKPENIMLRDDGYVKVLDFGLARLSGPDNPGGVLDTKADTHSGAVLGTVRYMSPEQARGERTTPASDMFSLGIVLYELATGQHPFLQETPLETLHAIIHHPALPPVRRNAQLPAYLNALIVRLLEKDLRLRPTAAETASALSEQSAAQTARVATPATTPLAVGGQRHTVGREQERAALQTAFATAAEGRGLLLCVTGEPGIGKTTLVEEALAELSAGTTAFRLARGRCSERLAGAEAYLPFWEALDSLLQADPSGLVANTMKRLAPTWYAQIAANLSDTSAEQLAAHKAPSQERLKRELVLLAQELATHHPLVLFFDDVHWADISTVDLLAYLASQFDGMRILVVVTYRPSELLLGKHPFQQVKLNLQGRGVCRELPLDFLTRADIERYLTLLFGDHHFPPDFAQLIFARTEGNPLFMSDVVRYLRDHQVITESGGHWALARALPEVERELPESVRGMVECKIAQLSEADRKLLTAASVQGYEFDSAVLAQALNLDPADVEEQLETLEQVHAFVRLVDEREFPDHTLTLRYRFVHALYQNALFGSLRPTRRTSLSAAIAQSLLEFYGERSNEVALRLAFLLETARDFARASDYFLLATQHAVQVFAHKEIVTIAQHGLDTLKALPETPERQQKELLLLMNLGAALMSTQGFVSPQIEEVYSRARALCQQIGHSPYLLKALYGLWTVYVIRANYQTALELAAQIMRLAEERPSRSVLMRAHFALGFTNDYMGNFLAARTHYENALEFYDPQNERADIEAMGNDVHVVALSRLARVRLVLGHPTSARQLTETCLATVRQITHPFSISCALLSVPQLFHDFGDAQKAFDTSETAIRIAKEYGFPLNLAYSHLHRGWAVARLGKIEEGLAEMRKFFALVRAIGTEMSFTGYALPFVELLAEAGQIEQALASVNETISTAYKNGELHFEADLHRVKGELLLQQAAEESDLRTAVSLPDATTATAQQAAEALFHQAIEMARRRHATSQELRAKLSLCRLWSQQGRPEPARALLAEAVSVYTSEDETPDLLSARALLAQLNKGDAAHASSPLD